MNSHKKIRKIALVNPFGDLPERFQKQKDYVRDFLKNENFDVADFLLDTSSSPDIRFQNFMKALESDADLILPLCGGEDYSIMDMLPDSFTTTHPKQFCGGSSLGILCAWISVNTNIAVSSGQHITFLHPKSSFQENLYSQLSWWNFLTDSVKVKGLSGAERKNVYQCEAVFSNVYRFLRKKSDVVVHHPEGLILKGKTLPCSLEQVHQIPVNFFENTLLITDSLDASPEIIKNLFQKLGKLGKISGIIFTANQRSDEEIKFPEYLDPDFMSDFIKTLSDSSGLPISHGFPFGHSKFKLPIPWNKDAVYDGEKLKLTNH